MVVFRQAMAFPMFATVVWHPTDHTAPPGVVALGRKPDLRACGSCHRADGALRVTGKVPITMTEWGIKPPTLMMGTIKVGQVVTVQFDLLLQH